MQESAALVQNSIRTLAYRLWEEQGRPEGKADLHWLEAESALRRTANPPANDVPKPQSAAPSVVPSSARGRTKRR